MPQDQSVVLVAGGACTPEAWLVAFLDRSGIVRGEVSPTCTSTITSCGDASGDGLLFFSTRTISLAAIGRGYSIIYDKLHPPRCVLSRKA